MAKRVKEIIGEQDIKISSLGIFGNPLIGAGDNADTLASWKRLIDIAPEFGTDLTSGFTGRMPGTIDESLSKFAEVFGDSNWTDIISILRQHGYEGSIDIEGFHDPIYKDDWEMTGQVHGLNYLKRCRGGKFIPNPK